MRLKLVKFVHTKRVGVRKMSCLHTVELKRTCTRQVSGLYTHTHTTAEVIGVDFGFIHSFV